MDNWGVGVPDSPVILLAQLMLKRSKLGGMHVSDRRGALSIIKGLRAPVSKSIPLTDVIQSAIGKIAREDRCSSCGKPLPRGSLCRTLWTLHDGTHIKCTGS
jgi:hypothetical protein